MALGFLSKLIKPVASLVSEFVTDKDEANRLTSALNIKLATLMEKELEAQKAIVLAEARGGWLQRNWRPMTMVWLAGLVGAHWFGFTPENLTTEAIEGLFTLVQIGLGGYVVGRSAEKIAPNFQRKD